MTYALLVCGERRELLLLACDEDIDCEAHAMHATQAKRANLLEPWRKLSCQGAKAASQLDEDSLGWRFAPVTKLAHHSLGHERELAVTFRAGGRGKAGHAEGCAVRRRAAARTSLLHECERGGATLLASGERWCDGRAR